MPGLSIRNRVMAALANDLATIAPPAYATRVQAVHRRVVQMSDFEATDPDVCVYLWSTTESKSDAEFMGFETTTMETHVAALFRRSSDERDIDNGELLADIEQCLVAPNARVIGGTTVQVDLMASTTVEHVENDIGGGELVFKVVFTTPLGQPRVPS